MGWILGLLGNYSDYDLQLFKSIYCKPLYSFQSNKLYIKAGGLSETCFAYSKNNSEGWIACGLGMKLDNGHANLMIDEDWNAELLQNDFDPFRLNGHFVVVRWKNKEVQLITDQLGLRNLFLIISNDKIVFSSRLDWITSFRDSSLINWEEIGSRWLLINQLSNECILENIFRLSQGGKAECTTDPVSVNIKNHHWYPHLAQSLPNRDIYWSLNEFTVCSLRNPKKVSLALSGGLDSRVLLALLLSTQKRNWCLHSFYDPDHPDRQISSRISAGFGLEHTFFDQPIPSRDECLSMLKEYAGQVMFTEPASGFLNLMFYSQLHEQGKIVIDGGLGEIARRRYLNNVLLHGRKALLNGRIKDIIPYLKVHRASIFNQECLKMMQNGIKKQIEILFENMPAIREFGIENWLDLFAIRTRFPNTASPEQSRSDSELVNYMPFAQPTFLRKMFETPVKERRNGKMFRKIIWDYQPLLSGYPLIKDGIIYPYKLSTVPASVWIKLKSKLGYVYRSRKVVQFLELLSDYIQDIVHSDSVKSFYYYDYQQIVEIVDGFYKKGNKAFASELNWWLAFETWRQSCKVCS